MPSPASRRSKKQALAVIAGICGIDPAFMPWQSLRFEHTSLIRAELMQSYKPATVTRILSALRKTLWNAWNLELMTAEQYARAVAVGRVTGETLPAGRAWSSREILPLSRGCPRDST